MGLHSSYNELQLRPGPDSCHLFSLCAAASAALMSSNMHFSCNSLNSIPGCFGLRNGRGRTQHRCFQFLFFLECGVRALHIPAPLTAALPSRPPEFVAV